jgi:hypothetical protein
MTKQRLKILCSSAISGVKMYRLILKDLRVSWQFFLTLFIMIPFVTAIAVWTMIDDFGGIIIGVITLITLAASIFSAFITIIVNSSSKSDMIFASLPVERRTMVNARYVSSYTSMLYGFGLIILTLGLLSWGMEGNNMALNTLLSLPGVLLMLSLLTILLAFILPFIFKFGSTKGAVRALVTQIVIVLFFGGLELLLKSYPDRFASQIAWITNVLKSVQLWLSSRTSFEILSVLIVLMILTVLTSLLMSKRFYLNLDL